MSSIFEGHPICTTLDDVLETSLTHDDILDNITLYWLTNTAICLARFYRENKLRIDLSCRERLPLPYLDSSTELGRKNIPTYLLQQARKRRTFCHIGAATTLFRGCSRRLHTTAQRIAYRMF